MNKSRIFKHFEGMNAFYNQKEQRVNEIKKQSDKGIYTLDFYKNEKKKAAQEIQDELQERYQNAIKEIGQLRSELQEKRFKDPYEKAIISEDKLLVEMKRMTSILMFKEEISAADNAEELKELYETHSDNEDFDKLFNIELKQRAKNDTDYVALQSELSQSNPELNELDRIESGFNMIIGSGMFPAGLEGAEDIKDLGLKNILGEESNMSTAERVALKQQAYL